MIVVAVRLNAKFQSLSGLTLCCDLAGGIWWWRKHPRFQSLSGLTLCCDAVWKVFTAVMTLVSIPFRADAVL